MAIPTAVSNLLDAQYEKLGKDTDLKTTEFYKILVELGLMAPSGKFKCRQEQVRVMTQRFFQRQPYKPDIQGGTWKLGTRCITSEELAARIYFENNWLQKDLFKIHVHSLLAAEQDKAWSQLRQRLLNTPATAQALEELNKFVKLLEPEGTDDATHTYNLTAFRQLIWQIKRRLRNKDTKWDIMVILRSGQGSGKSTAVERFAAPLGLFYLPDADFDLFKDAFRSAVFNKYYLICFDEMSRTAQADMDKIKSRITGKRTVNRRMHSEGEQDLERNASFIGTTNQGLLSNMYDASGMRRFAQIECTSERFTPEYGEKMNQIDFPLIWTCEDGITSVPPSAEHIELFQEKQAAYTVLSDVAYFCLHYLEETGEPADRLTNRQAYEAYRQLCDLQKHHPMSLQVFAAYLKERFDTYRIGNAVTYRGVRLIEHSGA